MKNVIQAYGVLASPLQISSALAALKVSHVIVDNSLRATPVVRDVAARQPAMPVVIPSLKALARHWAQYERQILYVCASLDELKSTNIRIIKNWRVDLRTSLEHAIANPVEGWSLVVNEPTMEDFVNVATKPSFLNHVQAEIYKLTPYDLRKEVQALVIAYLAGMETQAKLRAKLNSSYKLERLKSLMADPKCLVLRNAVADYRKTKDEAVTAKAFGVEVFEIMYLFKSSAKKQT